MYLNRTLSIFHPSYCLTSQLHQFGAVFLFTLLSITTFAQDLPPDAPTPWWMSYSGAGSEEKMQDMLIAGDQTIFVGSAGDGITAGDATFQSAFGGGHQDACIWKVDAQGAPMWFSYLGGGGEEEASSICKDNDGNLYIVGTTNTLSGLATSGAHQESGNFNEEIFILCLNSNGQRQWCTYFGGTGVDENAQIALSAEGNLIIAFTTTSTNLTVLGGAQATNGGGQDIFLSEWSTAGELLWSTYRGAAGNEKVEAVALSSDNNWIIAGQAGSAMLANGGFQVSYGGAGDGFINCYTSTHQLLWSTYVGGTGVESITDISSSDGFITATGYGNASTGVATMAGTYGGGEDAFVIQLSNGGARIWSRFIGGSNNDRGLCITQDIFGQIYVGGITNSPNLLAGNWTDDYTAQNDGLVAKLFNDGELHWSGYLGGSLNDQINDLKIVNGARIQFCGNTFSDNSVRYGYDQDYNGGGDGWFGIFQDCLNPEVTINIEGETTICEGDVARFYAGGADAYEWMNGDSLFFVEIDTTTTVYVIGYSASGCRSVSPSYEVNMIPRPEVSIWAEGPIEFCDSGTVVLHATGAETYQWDQDHDGDTFLCVNQGPVSAVGTAANGCSSSSNIILVIYNELPEVMMAVAENTVCISDGQVPLIGLPLNGTFVGDGVEDDFFDPFAAGGGFHDIYYTFTNEYGCTGTTPIETIEVVFSPTVLFLAEDSVCNDAAPVELIGMPIGGSFWGDGVFENFFYPDSAGTGPQTISYNFVDDNGCTNVAQQTIFIELCNGIEELTQSDVVLYGNPFQDRLRLALPGQQQRFLVKMFDAKGALVLNEYLNSGTQEIDTNFLSNGIFFLIVEKDSFSAQFKVEKQGF